MTGRVDRRVAGVPGRRRPSSFVERIGGEGAGAWKLHAEAVAAKRAGQDVIVLSVGDPDFATPGPIVEAAVAALHAGDTHYTPTVGHRALREAIAERYAARTGAATGARRVTVLPGAQNALFASSLCLLDAGDEALVPGPMYVTYGATVRASGARLVPVHAAPEDGFRPAPAALEAAVGPSTRAIFVANPNNPTGVVLGRDEAEGIADIARRHDLWVVSDEVYADLAFERPHVSIGALPGMAERTVTVSSLSKSHAMPGWRLGWAIAPDELVPHLANLALCMVYGTPGFIQAAALEALTGSLDEARRMGDVYRRRRDLVLQALAGVPELRALVPEAGMFAMVDVRGSGLAAVDFARELYRATGVSVLDASPFGATAEGFVRLSFSAGEAELEEACRRIAAFLAGRRQPRRGR